MKIVPDSVHSGLDQLRLDGLTNFLGWGPAHIARIPGELASLWGSGLCFLKSTQTDADAQWCTSISRLESWLRLVCMATWTCWRLTPSRHSGVVYWEVTFAQVRVQLKLLWTRTQNLHILDFRRHHMQAGQVGFLICCIDTFNHLLDGSRYHLGICVLNILGAGLHGGLQRARVECADFQRWDARDWAYPLNKDWENWDNQSFSIESGWFAAAWMRIDLGQHGIQCAMAHPGAHLRQSGGESLGATATGTDEKAAANFSQRKWGLGEGRWPAGVCPFFPIPGTSLFWIPGACSGWWSMVQTQLLQTSMAILRNRASAG